MDTNPNQINKKNKKDFFNLFLEVFGFIRIVASPFLIGIAIGFGVYISKPDSVGFIIAISIASIGLIVGIMGDKNLEKEKYNRLYNNCNITRL